MTNKSILIINGPGLANLSNSDGNSFGQIATGQIEQTCVETARDRGFTVDFRQTEDENDLFLWINQDYAEFDAMIINPIASSHAASFNFDAYQSAVRLVAHFKKPLIEVHLKNIFLSGSNIAGPLKVPEAETSLISGLGLHGYSLAIQSIAGRLDA